MADYAERGIRIPRPVKPSPQIFDESKDPKMIAKKEMPIHVPLVDVELIPSWINWTLFGFVGGIMFTIVVFLMTKEN